MTELDIELRRVLEEMTAGILAADQQGRILFANGALEAMSGYSREGLLELRVEDLVPRGERELHERRRLGYQRAASPPRPMGADLDIHLLRRDGSAFPADIALSPVQTAGGGNVVIAAVREKVEREGRGDSEPEAWRLERDLHERVLQTLFGLSLNLQTMAAQASGQPVSDRLANALHQVDDVVRDLRNYIYGIRPGILSGARRDPESPGRSGAD